MWLHVANADEPLGPHFESGQQDDKSWMKLEHSGPQKTAQRYFAQESTRRPSLQSSPAQQRSPSEAMLVPRSERIRCLVDTFHSLGVAAFHPRQRPHDPKSLACEWQLLHYLATTRMMQDGTQGGMALDSHGPLFDLVQGVGMRPKPTGSSAPCFVPPPRHQSSDNDTRNHPHHLSSAATAVFEGHEEGKGEEPSHPVLDTASLLFSGQAWVSSLTKAYPPSRRRALLIVCDASDALGLAERARMDGFAIEIARSALSGLALLAVQPFDVVVSELSFPMVDGLEMVQRLREFENDDEFLDRCPSPTDGHGKSKMQPRVQGGSRGAFVVLVRNGTAIVSGFEAEALDAGADYFVDEFDDVRFSNLQELLDEIQCDPAPAVPLAVSTRDEPFPLPTSPLIIVAPAPAPRVPSPILLPAPLPLLAIQNSSSSLATVSSTHTAALDPSHLHQLPVAPPARPPSAASTIATESSHVYSHSCCAAPQAASSCASVGTASKPRHACKNAGKRKASSAITQAGESSSSKIRRACSYCHTKKVSCSCTRPCTRCVELDLVCTDYEPRARSKRTRTTRPSSSLPSASPPPLEATYHPEPLASFLKPSPTTLTMPLGVDAPYAFGPPQPQPQPQPMQMQMQMPMPMHYQPPLPQQPVPDFRLQATIPLAPAVLRPPAATPFTQPPLYRQCTGPEPFLPPHMMQQPLPRLHAMTDGMDALPHVAPQDAVALGDSCPAPSALFRTVSEQNFFTSLHMTGRRAPQPSPLPPQAGYPLNLGPVDSFPTVLDEQVYI